MRREDVEVVMTVADLMAKRMRDVARGMALASDTPAILSDAQWRVVVRALSHALTLASTGEDFSDWEIAEYALRDVARILAHESSKYQGKWYEKRDAIRANYSGSVEFIGGSESE